MLLNDNALSIKICRKDLKSNIVEPLMYGFCDGMFSWRAWGGGITKFHVFHIGGIAKLYTPKNVRGKFCQFLDPFPPPEVNGHPNIKWCTVCRLYDSQLSRQIEDRQASRKIQVGTKSRSEKIRTYNFTQDRITDHRYVFKHLLQLLSIVAIQAKTLSDLWNILNYFASSLGAKPWTLAPLILQPLLLFQVSAFCFTGLHVQNVCTSSGTSFPNVHTKSFCWLLMHYNIMHFDCN